MHLKSLSRIITFGFSVTLAINFLLYAIQPYVPPSIAQHSKAYSIQNCPSHSVQNHLSQIIHLITQSRNDEGTEKHCFCFNRRGIQSSSFITFNPSITGPVDEYEVYSFALEESLCAGACNKNLSVRSPPIL